MLFSHAIIMQSCYRIPSLHLITCTYYPIVLLSYLVGCTSHLILLKRHFSSMLLSTRILFISLLFFFICITFIRVILFRALFFILLRAATVKDTVGWALARGSALPSMLGARLWSSVCSFLRKQWQR